MKRRGMAVAAVVSGLRLRIELLAWRHGWAGALALGMLLAAGALEQLLTQPAREALDRLEAVARAQPAARASAPAADAPAPLTGQSLARVLQDAPEPAAAVRELHALALAQDLVPARADYAIRSHAGVLGQAVVEQPLQASYPQLRRYLDSVLRALPSASLDQLSIQRAHASDTLLDIRLRWSFWRLPAGTTPPPQAPSLLERAVLVPTTPGGPADLFAVRRWSPEPPAAAAAPAPAEAAPAPPFSYLGRKLDEGRWEVFVLHEQQALALREGQAVAGHWRVERIAPPRMTLRYLPLQQPQTFEIGDPP